MTEKQRRKQMIREREAREKGECICPYQERDYLADPVVETVSYFGKYDFYQQGPRQEANIRRCQKCGGTYNDAPVMAGVA